LSLFTPQIIFRAHSGPVYCLEFINSNNHLKLASGGVDCIRVWDWNTIILIADESIHFLFFLWRWRSYILLFIFVLGTIFPLFELKTQHHLDSQMFLTCPNETNGLSFDPQVQILLTCLFCSTQIVSCCFTWVCCCFLCTDWSSILCWWR
jgi:WD40 repeat protein